MNLPRGMESVTVLSFIKFRDIASISQGTMTTYASLICTYSTPYPTNIGTSIVDIEAFNHMCSTFSLLENHIPITRPI